MSRLVRLPRHRARTPMAVAGLSAAALAGLIAGTGVFADPVAQATASLAPPPRETTALTGSIAPAAAASPAGQPVRGTQQRTIEVWLTGRTRAAERFVTAVSTPGSASYRHFLSPAAYSERFGPQPAEARAVVAYLRHAGLTAVRVSVDRDYVSATAPVARLERLFAMQLRRYTIMGAAARPLTFQSNDRALSVPAELRGAILAVSGLNSVQPRAGGAQTRGHSATTGACSRYWGQRTKRISPGFDGVTRAGVAVCGYSADQIRDAYGLGSPRSSRTPDGRGRTIALIQSGAPYEMSRTLTDYARANGLPAPRRGQYRQESAGRPATHRCEDSSTSEASLDSEVAYAMAPGADQLMVDGNACSKALDGEQGLIDAELQPLTGRGSSPGASVESVSYYFPFGSERAVPASVRSITHTIALRAAAEGVSLLFCSGDNLGVHLQASDPDVTAVGGTTLGIGAHGQRLFETGWSDGLGTRRGSSGPWRSRGIPFAGGGGVSVLYGQPAYQQGVVPRSMALNGAGQLDRAVPDLAADADPRTGILTGQINPLPHGRSTPYTPGTSYGTSAATPLVAAMVADAEQGQPRRFGFLNPLLYSLAGSRAFHDVLPETHADPQIDRVSYSTVALGGVGTIAPYLDEFDDQDRHDTRQVTARGYDTMTGLGSPDGLAFIRGLRGRG